ncbi:hypothetical protein [Hahella ganghwensis]|uniref:hypothetical protein n=1 Tax=Hahella ganghwensis TaxID=286420 RepID=UPI00036EC459|nr:hypothetical protein [Hahella ganghwensis]
MSRSIHVTRKIALESFKDGDAEKVEAYRLKKIIKKEYPKYRKQREMDYKKDVAPSNSSVGSGIKKVIE